MSITVIRYLSFRLSFLDMLYTIPFFSKISCFEPQNHYSFLPIFKNVDMITIFVSSETKGIIKISCSKLLCTSQFLISEIKTWIYYKSPLSYSWIVFDMGFDILKNLWFSSVKNFVKKYNWANKEPLNIFWKFLSGSYELRVRRITPWCTMKI